MELTRRLFIEGLAAAGLAAGARATEAAQVPDLSHLTPEQRAKYQAMHARMMAALTYEHVTVAGEHALAEWERLKGAGRGWPVVIGSDEDLERIADQFSMGDPVAAGLAPPPGGGRAPARGLPRKSLQQQTASVSLPTFATGRVLIDRRTCVHRLATGRPRSTAANQG
jgi:hypothetical protein